MIIDIHSHFLPGIDDGAKNALMGLYMLKESYSQGIECCIATPHYMADRPVEKFVAQRNAAYKSLGDLSEGYPEVHLWAETYYTPMLKYMDLRPLSLNGSILLELPFREVDDQTLYDISYIRNSLGYNIVIAHVERYKKIDRLLDMDVGIQINAEAANTFLARHLIRKKRVDFIASDMHNMTTRPPNLGETLKSIRAKHPEVYSHLIFCAEDLID